LFYKLLKNTNNNIFLIQNSYELIFVVFALSFTISKFTFNLFDIFVEAYNPISFLGFAIILSILIACYNNLNKTLDQQSEVLQNNPITGIIS